MSKVDLYHTNDMELIRSFMLKDEIWETSVEDVTIKDNFYPGQDALSVWLLAKIKNELIGVLLVNHSSSCAVDIHPYLLKQHKKHGRDLIKSFFKWFLSLPDDLCKVNCSIPDHLKIVQNFALKVGFKQEGINKASFMYNGKAQDQKRYGLTREEIKGLLWLV